MFQHTPLDLQQPSIRLVEVLPPDPSGYVYCNVKHATINDEYTCVSYVWGPPEDTHCIYLNGQPFRVRRNLLEFLETVSSQSIKPKPKSPRLDFRQAATSLWIDALCIDQGNNGERNHQVQQMGKIFEHAQRVIAWIGKKTAYASLFRYMRDELRNQRFFDANHFIALDGLCKDVYWQRAWITQEIQLALQTLLLADTEEVDLTSLRGYVQRTIFDTFGACIHNELWQPVQQTIETHYNSSVSENMYRYRRKQCSDPLDLAYSILSISTDGAGVGVEYGISRLQLAHKILSLFGHALCLWNTWRVLWSLQIYSFVDESNTKPFVNIQASMLDTSTTCPDCEMAIDWQDLPEFVPSKTYIHCLTCEHKADGTAHTAALAEHLLLYDLNPLDSSHTADWYLYKTLAYPRNQTKLVGGPRIATINSDGTSATVHVPLEALCKLINNSPIINVIETQVDWHSKKADEDTHIRAGWSLAD